MYNPTKNSKDVILMYKSKMMIVVRRDLKMRKGKIAAQASHASVEAILCALKKEERLNDIFVGEFGAELKIENKEETPLSEWFSYGCAKICVYVDSEEERFAIDREAKKRGIISAVITDAGMTEFHGVPTVTCLALEPLPSDIANELTGHLSLY